MKPRRANEGLRSNSLHLSFGGGLGWGSSEEAPDACFPRRFLVLIFFVMSTPLLPRDRARQLRREQTDAERRLWTHLRRHQLGVQFRRQHPIGPYIVDFCCVERMLVVELDGRAARRAARAGRGAHSVARRAGLSHAALFGSRSADADGGGSHGDSEPPVDPHPNPPPKLRGRELRAPTEGEGVKNLKAARTAAPWR
jgi:Protein of unknown function (DUF559)